MHIHSYIVYCDDYDDEALYHSIVCGAIKEERRENVPLVVAIRIIYWKLVSRNQ